MRDRRRVCVCVSLCAGDAPAICVCVWSKERGFDSAVLLAVLLGCWSELVHQPLLWRLPVFFVEKGRPHCPAGRLEAVNRRHNWTRDQRTALFRSPATPFAPLPRERGRAAAHTRERDRERACRQVEGRWMRCARSVPRFMSTHSSGVVEEVRTQHRTAAAELQRVERAGTLAAPRGGGGARAGYSPCLVRAARAALEPFLRLVHLRCCWSRRSSGTKRHDHRSSYLYYSSPPRPCRARGSPWRQK